MTTDYVVPGRSNRELRDIANRLRTSLGLGDIKIIDIISCLTSGWVETVKGKKRLVVKILPDDEMGKDDARAISDRSKATVEVKASVWQARSPD
jgi:hypothetical protein